MLFQAGMQAVRENRYVVLAKDFEKGYKNNIKKDETEHEFYKWTLGCHSSLGIGQNGTERDLPMSRRSRKYELNVCKFLYRLFVWIACLCSLSLFFG